ncbi:hypothetical protein EU523_01855, partial [Candidatus Heimdallarchaeota archaeon]
MGTKNNEEPLKIIVDLWATELHAVEIGIRKHELFEAKERQFSKDLELFGRIKENGEKKGYIGFRKEAIEGYPHQQRLIIKSFSKTMNWEATIEELVAVEFSRSMGVHRSLPSFIINIANYEPL